MFNNHRVILTLIIHWLGPLLSLPWGFEATLAVWGERRAKDPCQKNTPLVVRLKPALLRIQIHAFYQLAIPPFYHPIALLVLMDL